MKDLTSTLGVDLDNLWGAELYYNAEFTPWLHVTADVQLTANQNKHDDTATILGMRAVINF